MNCLRSRLPALLLVSVGALLGLVAATAFDLAPRLQSLYERTRSKIERTIATPANPDPSDPTVAGWTTAEGLRIEAHSTGFDGPVRLAFHPGRLTEPDAPLYYVAQIDGTVFRVDREGHKALLVSGLLNFPWKPLMESGLLGLGIDAEGSTLFVGLSYWDEDGGVYRNRVERLALSADGRSVTGPTVLLDMKDESTVPSYQVQFAQVAPDGSLFVGVGAGATMSDALELDKFAGKVLRMDRDGHALPDNPFYDPAAPEAARSYVYASGMRNPFDLAWDPRSGLAFVTDVGPGVDRLVLLERGASYCFSGNRLGDDQMRCNALFTWGPLGHHSPVGLAFSDDSRLGLGAGWSLFVGLYGSVHNPGPDDGKRVSRMHVAESGLILTVPEIAARYEGAFFSSVTDVEVGPDGIYFVDPYGLRDSPHQGDGSVLRLVRDPTPRPRAGPLLTGKALGEHLFVSEGCIACHAYEPSQGKKVGTELMDLASRLSARLGSRDYEASLDALSRRESAFFVKNRGVYAELQRASGKERARLWLRNFVANPRFDNPQIKMPAYAHLDPVQLDALVEFLSAL